MRPVHFLLLGDRQLYSRNMPCSEGVSKPNRDSIDPCMPPLVPDSYSCFETMELYSCSSRKSHELQERI